MSFLTSSYAILASASLGVSGAQGSAGTATMGVDAAGIAVAGVFGESDAQNPPSAKAFLVGPNVADNGVTGPDCTTSQRGREIVDDVAMRGRCAGRSGCALVSDVSEEEPYGNSGCPPNVLIECVGGGGCQPNTITLFSFAARAIRRTASLHLASVNRSLFQYITCFQYVTCCSLVRPLRPHFSCFFISSPVAGEISFSSFSSIGSASHCSACGWSQSSLLLSVGSVILVRGCSYGKAAWGIYCQCSCQLWERI